MRKLTFFLLAFQLLLLPASFAGSRAETEPATITIPLGGNGYVEKNGHARIKNEGLSNWSDASDVIAIYFRTEAAGDAELSLRLSVPEGNSKISLTVAGTTLTKEVNNLGAAIIKSFYSDYACGIANTTKPAKIRKLY